MSVGLWIKSRGTGNKNEWEALVTKGDSAWRIHRAIGTEDINCAINYDGSGNFRDVTATGMTAFDGNWHYVACVFDGTNLTVYVDDNAGVSTDYDTAADINTSSDKVAIGENLEATGRHFDGKIDEVAIWNSALGPTEITALYNSGTPLSAASDSGNYASSADLVAYYTMDSNSGTGTSLTDDSTKSNTGTLNSGVSWSTSVPDSTSPTLSSSTPADDATGVAVDANIVLNFSEAVDVESGNIVLYKSDGSTIETFDVASSGLVTGTGTTAITINPTSDLDNSTGYYLHIASTAFDDSSSNFYAGISDSTTLNFTTVSGGGGDTTPPTMTITATEVSDGDTSEDSTLSMTFASSESTSNFVVGDITVGNGTLSSFSGSGTTYTAMLTPTTEGEVTVDVAVGSFTDAASNNNTAAEQFNWTYLTNPIAKKDVVGSVESWTNIASRWANDVMDSVANRLSWLSRHKDTTKTSHQGIKLHFEDKVIDAVMNATPRSKASIVADIKNIDIASNAVALLQDTKNALVATSDGIKSDAQGIAINEVARFRNNVIGTLNPSFGTVVDDWSVWSAGQITIGESKATSTASKQEVDSHSITLGFDKPIGDDKQDLFGVVLSIGQDDTDIGTSTSNIKSDNYSLSTYSVFKQDNDTTVETVFGLGHLRFDTTRKDGSYTLTGKRNANQVFASATLRDKTIEHNNWSISPYGKTTLAHTKLKKFSEAGSVTALTFNEQTINNAKVYIGADANYLITIRNGSVKPFAKLEYGLDLSGSSTVNMHYNNETTNYQLQLDNKADSNWKFVLGTDLYTEDEWDSSISYERTEAVNAGYSDSLAVKVGLKF